MKKWISAAMVVCMLATAAAPVSAELEPACVVAEP